MFSIVVGVVMPCMDGKRVCLAVSKQMEKTRVMSTHTNNLLASLSSSALNQDYLHPAVCE